MSTQPDDRADSKQTSNTRRAANGAVQRIVDAATELVRERSYAELSVGEIMERAGIGRTIFYRHFDDLGDLLLRAGARGDRGALRGPGRRSPRPASAPTRRRPARRSSCRSRVYREHGPVLRALSEAAAADRLIAARLAELRGASTSWSPKRLSGQAS